MKRRDFLRRSATATTAMAMGPFFSMPMSRAANRKGLEEVKPFELDEATITDLQKFLESGKYSAVSLVRRYLERIEHIDRNGPRLNSIIELNPDALNIARELDRERKAKGPRGPLHGIPLLIKDNLDTHDRMATTAGSLALVGSIPARDSFVVEKLRQAGAVILGKTNLSEWANFRSSDSTSGWSGRGGLTRNPYVLDRNPSGSSSGSGVAVAASLCAAAIGTETDGSILSPSSVNGIVGVKPTVGLVSRSGIIPIAHSQDTAGPMARTVRDAAILLGAIAGVDPRDPATAQSDGRSSTDYTRFLSPDGLRGARVGVARKFSHGHDEAKKLYERAVDEMRRMGAEIIDPADLPSHGKIGGAEFQVLLYEFKADLNAYLAALGPSAPVQSLQEVIQFNERHADRELVYFGQDTLLKAEAKGPLTEREYVEALEKCRRLSREEGIDAIMSQHRLDAIVAPTTGPAHVTDLVHGDRGLGGSTSPAAVAGYPSITVPLGFVSGLPVGISFFGRAFS
ncbi:MAG: amidase, partial [Verrucomicrobiota bacterium]